MIWPSESLQTQNIRRRPVKYKEDRDIGAKLLAEPPYRRFRLRIVPISHLMPLIRPLYGLQHLWMHYRIVIAGKTSSRFHHKNNLAELKILRTLQPLWRINMSDLI